MKKDTEQLLKLRLAELVVQLREAQTEEDAVTNPTEVDDEEWLSHPQISEDTIIQDLQFKVTYCTIAMEFITFVTSASDHVVLFLNSKNATDTVETLQFLKRAVNFCIKDSAKHLRRYVNDMSQFYASNVITFSTAVARSF
jgi:hypothetical protein